MMKNEKKKKDEEKKRKKKRTFENVPRTENKMKNKKRINK